MFAVNQRVTLRKDRTPPEAAGEEILDLWRFQVIGTIKEVNNVTGMAHVAFERYGLFSMLTSVLSDFETEPDASHTAQLPMFVFLDENSGVGAGIVPPAKVGDAGYDLSSCCEHFEIPAHQFKLIDTGVHLEILAGHAGLIIGRSSMNARGIFCQVGLIDSGYRGPIKVLLMNFSDQPVTIKAGERIAQLVITSVATPALQRVAAFEALSATPRGEDGFGSTGR